MTSKFQIKLSQINIAARGKILKSLNSRSKTPEKNYRLEIAEVIWKKKCFLAKISLNRNTSQNVA